MYGRLRIMLPWVPHVTLVSHPGCSCCIACNEALHLKPWLSLLVLVVMQEPAFSPGLGHPAGQWQA